MAQTRFDPSHAVKFDLGRGVVQLDGSADRLLVPADALLALCGAAGEEAARDFGRKIGAEIGRRAAGRLGTVAQAGLEDVLEHLGGDLALAGFGSLGIERWGRALVMTVSDCPLGAAGDGLLAAVLEGAIQRALGRDATVVPLARDGASARLLVVGEKAARAVRGWLAEGVQWGDALARLHARGEA